MMTNERQALAPWEALAASLTLITAHSGCEGTPPNSRAHILRAIASKAEMIEIDVRMEGDHLYLCHDLPESTADCVSLADCFALVTPHEYLMINCDVKTDGLVAPVVRLAERYGIVHRIVFTGQCNHAMEQVLSLGADMWHSLWRSDDPDGDVDRAIRAVRATGCQALNIDYHMASARQQALMADAGLRLSVWTVDDEEALRALLAMGVFNITTRRPSLALRLRDEIQGRHEARRLPLEAIAGAVKCAGKQLLTAATPGGVYAKEGVANYASQRDLDTEAYLIDALSGLVPGAAFISEESRFDPAPKEGIRFVIDPIDGTMNYLHDYRCSTVSVGVLQDGHPIFGVIYNPYAGELFTALRGAGASLNGRRIRVSTRGAAEALIAVGTSSYYKEALQDAVVGMMGDAFRLAADIRRSGSAAAEFCNVACGRAEGFFEMRLAPWDYTAGALIVREAGGVVSDMRGGMFGFDASACVLCANRVLYKDLLGITQRYGATCEGGNAP